MTERTNEAAVGGPYVCPAALSLNGEHYPCDWMAQMASGSIGHEGWAHANGEARAIWTDGGVIFPPAHPNPEPPTGDGGREGVGRRG